MLERRGRIEPFDADVTWLAFRNKYTSLCASPMLHQRRTSCAAML
jgi:hypothetical protein